MNVENGAEAAQFPEKEYINGIAFAVLLLITLLQTEISKLYWTELVREKNSSKSF